MIEYLIQFKDWVVALGEKHGVDPLLLGCLYLVSKVSLFTFLGFVLKNLKQKKPVLTLILFAAASFSLPYLYLIIAGRNIPLWVYIFIAAMFIYSGFTVYKKINEKSPQVNA